MRDRHQRLNNGIYPYRVVKPMPPWQLVVFFVGTGRPGLPRHHRSALRLSHAGGDPLLEPGDAFAAVTPGSVEVVQPIHNAYPARTIQRSRSPVSGNEFEEATMSVTPAPPDILSPEHAVDPY